MANVKISGLTAAAAAAGANEFEINEAGTSKKVTGSQILTYVKANTTPADIGAFATASAGTNVVTALGVSLNNATGGLVTADGSVTLANKTLTNPTVNNYVEGVVPIGTVTTLHTFSLTNGTVQTATLTASTACTFTMPTATAGKSFILYLKQAAATGNGTATFTSVKWTTTPTVTATAGKMDIFSFFADGTNWYGVTVGQGYTP